MTIELGTPDDEGLRDAVRVLASWQRSGDPLQLHPGDVGWFRRLGARAATDAVRAWSADGRLVAVGLLDGRDLLRATTAPELRRDAALAAAMADDIARPERGILGPGPASLEVPSGALLDERMADAGWAVGEPWTPLERDLSEPVEGARASRLRIVEVDGTDPGLISAWSAVQRSAFGTVAAVEARWYAMADGPAFRGARCLLGLDGDAPAAGVIAWSAGEGRPGLIEPMGVHAEHRGRGHGTAITLAAAAALRALGASSAQVCTESAREPAIATYRAAGFVPQPTRFDRVRAA
ncbi:GNAT family N-acetyltransferase [Agrococcus sp. HG114]|uniref:GNAT family N-acetyltransferase n=1 Tax=Agrococcus sp. HG114 TaxID=2969757 RepID=UPI00215A74FA|nr:GNAT family N-acetyltransferase [Agrococcus sp. HG114]MCR8670974.1 GNAT family N-acetyltransferase [Agrococcus sp. HG114]